MELISQHTKKIMEGCKERAKSFGLDFQKDTLEYIVTNTDLLELSPKVMIPTLYDYWVHDVEVLQGKGRYELYPNNAYETVINTRPAISFYNDNNPDWLNVMIFYHVLAHIDFFQNNQYFKNTWDYDFTAKALADKKTISSLRSKHGHWVDYIIEFARGIDNIVGYQWMQEKNKKIAKSKIDFYFDKFIQTQKISPNEYLKEIERYNKCIKENKTTGEDTFFEQILIKYPEFKTMFEEYKPNEHFRIDLMQYIIENSEFLNKKENIWMKTVVQIVRDTSIYFQPQIRTKIMNEGWASYWHEKLFMMDDRISGHEVDFARVHSGVASLPIVGLNPYALGLRLFYHIEDLGNKGKDKWAFHKIANSIERKNFDNKINDGQKLMFSVRKNLCDFTFLNTFVDQEFVTKNKLYIVSKRVNLEKMVYEFYIKSKKLSDYREMLFKSLYHPPSIKIDKNSSGELHLTHEFENKPLYETYIANTMMGIEYLWGKTIHLDTFTTEIKDDVEDFDFDPGNDEEEDIEWKKIRYTMQNKRLTKTSL
jgi:stage V sporulation protein R